MTSAAAGQPCTFQPDAMKLASYIATRPGWQGLFNRLIRLRFSGLYSHSEVVFEPGDGVDQLMPDGTCGPDAGGALWCASSVAMEWLPAWSRYRAGKLGGVRFKRIVLDPVKWDVLPVSADPLFAAVYAVGHEGNPYSWRLIAKLAAWVVAFKVTTQTTCSQICAAMFGVPDADAWRFDPCALRAAVKAKEFYKPIGVT